MMQFSNVEEMFKVPVVPKAANGQRKNSSKFKQRKRKYSVTFNEGRFTGELVYHQADPEALKCLIAANMTGCLPTGKTLKAGSGLSIKTNMIAYYKGGKQLRLNLKEVNESDSEQGHILRLKNPFTIAWIIYRLSEDQFEKQAQTMSNGNGIRSRTSSLSSNQGRPRTISTSSEYFPFSDIVQAQIMQWNDFTCSEIKPFISAIAKKNTLDPAIGKASSTRDLRRKVSSALDVLNSVLEKKSFLMGNRCTLADICVAVDLIPIMDSKLASEWSELAELQKTFEKEHHVYLKKWFTNVLQMPFVTPIRKKMKCFLPPEALQNKPNNQGDAKAKGEKLAKPNNNIIQVEGNKKDSLINRRKKLLDAKAKESNEPLPKEVKKKANSKELRATKQEKVRAANEELRAAKLAKAKAARKVLEEKYQSIKNDYDRLDKLPVLKVIALHDYRQNDQMFSSMFKKIQEVLGDKVQIRYVNAPNIPLAFSSLDISHNLRAWWFSGNSDNYDRHSKSEICKGWEASLSTLVSVIKKEGPFDGIMGFSQGAALAGMMCLDSIVSKVSAKVHDENALSYDCLFPPELSSFKFAVLFSGFCSKSSTHEKIYEKISEIRKLEKIDVLEDCMIPTLHAIGVRSRIVSKRDGEKLANLFGKKHVQRLYYDGGHVVPSRKLEQRMGYLEFFSKVKRICFGDVEISAGIEKMVLSSAAVAPEESSHKDIKTQQPKNVDGANHPVIRAIQDP